jgi:hypothetical protein
MCVREKETKIVIIATSRCLIDVRGLSNLPSIKLDLVIVSNLFF